MNCARRAFYRESRPGKVQWAVRSGRYRYCTLETTIAVTHKQEENYEEF